jgi:hypothetical protein
MNCIHDCTLMYLQILSEWELDCRRFETGGSLSRRVNVAACPSPDGSTRGRARRGESEAARDRRERGGNPAAFVFVPRPGRVRLQ